MPQIPYNKPPLTYLQQLEQLKNRGLAISDDARALHLLRTISYYRLSGYWYPMLADKVQHIFKANADFDNAFRLYCFDRQLRQLVSAELEKIEVAVRAELIYVLSQRHGGFWFQDPTLFRNPVSHAATMTKLGDEYGRSDEEFIQAFQTKYSNALPPAWMMLEITSFGTLSMLYKNLNPGQEKRAIAQHFGVSDSVFQSWLHSFVYLRNICAHHARLWNRMLSITPLTPKNPQKTWLANRNIRNDRVYFVLCVIQFLLQTVNPSTRFPAKVKALLQQHPNADPRAMGFPANWQQEALWK